MIYELTCNGIKNSTYYKKENALKALKKFKDLHRENRCKIYDETEFSFTSVQPGWMETTVSFKVKEIKLDDEDQE